MCVYHYSTELDGGIPDDIELEQKANFLTIRVQNNQLTEMVQTLVQHLGTVPVAGSLLAALAPTLIGMIVGVIAGALVLGVVTVGRRALGGSPA